MTEVYVRIRYGMVGKWVGRELQKTWDKVYKIDVQFIVIPNVLLPFRFRYPLLSPKHCGPATVALSVYELYNCGWREVCPSTLHNPHLH